MVIVSQIPVAITKAYSPGHITGFFSIPNQNKMNLESKFQGSLGAGFSIDAGITSTVKIFPSSAKKYEIKLNGFSDCDLKVSKFVTEYYLRLTRKPVLVSVEHDSNLPIGYGLGSSGSAALSLSYALNEALGANLTKLQAAQIAHEADIVCNTGRGTVISEYTGGLELRLGIGGPGVGRILKTDLPSQWMAAILCIEPIRTEFYLSAHLNAKKNQLLNKKGKQMTVQLSNFNNIDAFLELSYEFASLCGLTEGKCKEPLKRLRAEGYKSSVALFGHTLFTVTQKDNLCHIVDILKQYKGKLIVCGIDNLGARVLNNLDEKD